MDPNYQYPGYADPQMPGQTPKNIRKYVLFGAGVFMLVVGLIALLLLLLGGSGSRKDVVSIISLHTEIERFADLGLESDRARSSTKDFAATMKISSTNTVAAMSGYVVDRYSNEPSKLELEADLNEGAESTLEEAARNNTYDKEFFTIAENILSASSERLSKLYDITGDEELKRLLVDANERNQVLLDSLAER